MWKCTFILLVALIGKASAENWPQFRGPTGQGVSNETNLPERWSNTEGVIWKAEIPGAGHSSPVVWGQRVFLTATSPDGVSCHVLCLDRESGKILWNTKVFEQKPTRKEPRNSYATPTPVADGQNVYVFFSSGSGAAVSFEGKVLWTNQENEFYSRHGLGASPRLFEDLVIIPFDWSNPPPEESVGWQKPWDKSFILALDKKTGKERWKAKRGLSRIAHVTPQIAEVYGKAQLVSGAGDVIQGHDPKTGELIWTVRSQGEGVVPSVVIGDGFAFTSSGFENTHMRAVRLGGARGEVTKSHLAWESREAVSVIPSFVYAGGLLFSVTDKGIATCRDPKTGDVIWKQRLEGSYAASPVYGDGKLYFLAEDGTTTVAAAGREYKEIARNPVGENCQASMAVSEGKLFIRGAKHLYCIGKKN